MEDDKQTAGADNNEKDTLENEKKKEEGSEQEAQESKREKKAKKKERKKKKLSQGKSKEKVKAKKEKEEKFDVIATLSPEQKDLLIAFKKRLGLLPYDDDEPEDDPERQELSEKEKEWCDDMCLCRYLRAREWDLDLSETMIRNSLKWREEYKPEEITAEDIESEAQPGKMYFRFEVDKFKRPVVYMKPARDNSTDRVIKLKYLVWILEESIKHMDAAAGVEKMTWIVDFSNTGLRQSSYSNIQVSLDCLHVLMDHYPERLGVAFLLNTPWMFGAFWKCISPWLNEVTLSKIRFLGKTEYAAMLDTIDADVLEKNYGGDHDIDYDHDEWKKRYNLK